MRFKIISTEITDRFSKEYNRTIKDSLIHRTNKYKNENKHEREREKYLARIRIC